MESFNPLVDIWAEIHYNGGFVNSHAHLDRAFTINKKNIEQINNHLFEKWRLVDSFKSRATVEDYYSNISRALESQKEFGVQAVLSFIDLDHICGTNALEAALLARDTFKDIKLRIACQTLKGVLNKQSRSLIENSIHCFDVIGSLPGADAGKESEHLDMVINWAKETGKPLHVHVDQLNSPHEKETELLARKVMKHGYEGHVTAVHSISLACHPKKYRNEVYKMSRDAGLNFITCPGAWIDHTRSETKTPTHNSITPVDELLQNDLIVGIGTDNIHDLYKPFADGDMRFETRLLIEALRIQDKNIIKKICIDNGKKIIGL